MSTHNGNPDGEGRGLFVLDVDPGIDDAVALFLAHRLVRERCVVATSFGNAPLEVTHRNLVGLKRAFGCPFPVVKGSAGPLSGREPFFDFYHGTDALGDLSHLLPEGDEKAPPLEALAGFAAPGERVVYCARGRSRTWRRLSGAAAPWCRASRASWSWAAGCRRSTAPTKASSTSMPTQRRWKRCFAADWT